MNERGHITIHGQYHDLYDLESIDEAISEVQAKRKKYKLNVDGVPHEVAQYNVWTILLNALTAIREDFLLKKGKE